MTDRLDLASVVTDWLLDGAPPRAADRVLNRALSRVATTPQDRSRLFPGLGTLPWLGERRSDGSWRQRSPLVVVLVVAGMLIAVAVAGTALWNETLLPIEISASPEPSRSPAPSVEILETPTASATAAPDKSVAPIGVPGAGTISFTRYGEGYPRLYLIDPSGANETELIQNRFGCCGVFHPDGQSIAVGYEEIDQFRGEGALAAARVIGLDGVDLFDLPASCGGCFSLQGIEWLPRAWSSDGSQIALEVTGLIADYPIRDGIHIADNRPATGPWYWNRRYATGENVRDVPIAFSSDGSRLLFLRVADETATDQYGELFVLDIKEVATRRVSGVDESVATGTVGSGAAWSPDGAQIAFSARSTGGDSRDGVFVVTADGGARQLVADAARTVAWSPDGAWLAIAGAGDGAEAGEGGDLFVIRPDGSGRRNLTAEFDRRIVGATWSPDGTGLLAFALVPADDKEGHLIVIPLDGGPIAQVTSTPAQYGEFSWGPISRDDK